jgi:thiosulfate reductase cytochrome b subunit
MGESVYLRGLAVADSERVDSPRHSILVRLTHGVTTIGFLGLCVSGFAILLAHPHLYWGETGGIGTPSLIDFPLPTMIGGPSGWGRSLHFVSAWICILTGLLYGSYGIFARHFREHLLPARNDLSWASISRAISDHLHLRRPVREELGSYNVLQRLSYVAVIFVLFPLVIWTGFAMSPALTSVFPFLVTTLGGQQSARTIHFFVASLLVFFLLVHVVMVCVTNFTPRMRAMIVGDASKPSAEGQRP